MSGSVEITLLKQIKQYEKRKKTFSVISIDIAFFCNYVIEILAINYYSVVYFLFIAETDLWIWNFQKLP